MSRTVLIVFAHPEPTSLTRQLVDVSMHTLRAQGHEVLTSDLYAMRWKAVFDEHDFPTRADPTRLDFMRESAHSYTSGRQTADVEAEQNKVMRAHALLFHFPLWWYGMPAILKGWFDRVWANGLAYGYRNAGNRYRYGEGAFAGKRALLSVAVGGPAADYSPRGINGPLEDLLFPVTHGTLFFPGLSVLPTFAVYSAARMSDEEILRAKANWAQRVEHLFETRPIAFRTQNGGDYPDGHVLSEHVATGQTGLRAHINDDASPHGSSEELP